jgi:hypothetical protein
MLFAVFSLGPLSPSLDSMFAVARDDSRRCDVVSKSDPYQQPTAELRNPVGVSEIDESRKLLVLTDSEKRNRERVLRDVANCRAGARTSLRRFVKSLESRHSSRR